MCVITSPYSLNVYSNILYQIYLNENTCQSMQYTGLYTVILLSHILIFYLFITTRCFVISKSTFGETMNEERAIYKLVRARLKQRTFDWEALETAGHRDDRNCFYILSFLMFTGVYQLT